MKTSDSKRLVVLAIVVGIVGAVVAMRYLGDRGDPPAAGSAVVAPSKPPPAVVSVIAATPGGSLRLPALAHDDDPTGTIRLDGQVIDDKEQPVAGARVSIDANPPKTTETDASGAFVFEGLIARDYRVEASAATGYAGPARVRLGPKPEILTLRLRPGGPVEVVVTEAGTNTPVAGADVELRATVTYQATTDAKGVATLAHVGPVWAPLVAKAAGYSPAAMMLGTSGDAAAPVRVGLVLSRGAAVSGTVVDDAGKPLAGVRVVATQASEPFPVVDPRRDGVETRADGTFEIATLAAGTWRLTATHGTFAPTTSAPLALDGRHPRGDVKLVLVTGATLAGKVVDASGAPVASADVRVVVRGRVFWRARRQAFTAADGTFAIAGLPRRQVDVVATHATGSSKIVAVDLEAKGSATLELALDVTGTIAGTVVDSAGITLADAQVIAEAEPTGTPAELATWSVRGAQETVTDQAGAFAFAGLPDGNYRVRASRPGAGEGELELAKFTVARPGGAKLRLVVPNDGSVTGKVVFADGKVPVDFTIALGTSYATPFAATDGRFSIPAVAGTHTLVVDGKSFLASKSQDVIVVEGKATDVGTITVVPGRSVSGRVLDENGNAVKGAKVAAGILLSGGGADLYIADESLGAKDTTTDADGHYSLDGFSPAPITVVAGNGGNRSASVRLPAGGDSATLDLVLQETAGLDGTITSGGKPLGDTVVIANPFGATSSNFFVVTGADGTFVLDALAPGPYLVFPMIGGGGPRPKDMYVVRVEVTPGVRAHVAIDATPGPVTVAVTARTDAGKAVAAAQVYLIAATITAHSLADLTSLDQLGVFGATPIAVQIRGLSDGAIDIDGVRPGTFTLCVAALAGRPPDDPSSVPVTCVPVAVGAAAKQAVAVTVSTK